jgi:hypothetical protein
VRRCSDLPLRGLLKLPTRLQTAIEALYGHYEKTFKLWLAYCAIRGRFVLSRRPRPHQPKKPAGLSRQASYAVTRAGPWGRSAIACDPTRAKLRNGWTRP